MEENLKEHLEKWLPFIETFGLLMIELHTIAPHIAAQMLENCCNGLWRYPWFQRTNTFWTWCFSESNRRAWFGIRPQAFFKYPNNELCTVSIHCQPINTKYAICYDLPFGHIRYPYWSNRTFTAMFWVVGRVEEDHWVDFDFFGHQLVVHLKQPILKRPIPIRWWKKRPRLAFWGGFGYGNFWCPCYDLKEKTFRSSSNLTSDLRTSREQATMFSKTRLEMPWSLRPSRTWISFCEIIFLRLRCLNDEK